MNRHNLTIKEFTFAIIITLCLAIGTFTMINYLYEADYQRDMVVVAIEENNKIVLEDINGYTWNCYVDELKIGDTVIAYFNDNNTSETIFDDEIIRIEILCYSKYGAY